MTGAISKQAAEVKEAAHRNGLRPDDDLALLLSKITDLANAVGNATADGRSEATLRQLGAAAQKLADGATVHEEEIGRAMFRAGLTVAPQLAVRVERRRPFLPAGSRTGTMSAPRQHGSRHRRDERQAEPLVCRFAAEHLLRAAISETRNPAP